MREQSATQHTCPRLTGMNLFQQPAGADFFNIISTGMAIESAGNFICTNQSIMLLIKRQASDLFNLSKGSQAKVMEWNLEILSLSPSLGIRFTAYTAK
jgi:hypothetical protein